MRVITVQHTNALKQLLNTGKYTVPDSAPVSCNLIEPYRFMMKHYNYKHRPIFMCPVGLRANFGGAKTDNAYLIELEIPDRYCKVQDYYCWSDFIYFREEQEEYEEFNGCKTVKDFGIYTLDMFKNCKFPQDYRKELIYQVTTQFLLKSWIINIKKIDNKFIDKYVDTGGVNILDHI